MTADNDSPLNPEDISAIADAWEQLVISRFFTGGDIPRIEGLSEQLL